MSGKRTRRNPPPIVLGPLPVDRINKAMGTELSPGLLIVPVGMDKHIAKKRPGEYARLLPHLGSVTTNPLYVGDDFKNPGNIELIGHIVGSGGEFVLVALCITRGPDGHYGVRTFYSIEKPKIDDRRQKGFLKLLP